MNCACWSVCLLKSRGGALRQAKNTFNAFYYSILRHSMKFGHLKRKKKFRKYTVTCSPGNMVSWAEVQLCSGSDWQCDILIRSLLVMFQKHCCPSMFEVHRSSVVFLTPAVQRQLLHRPHMHSFKCTLRSPLMCYEQPTCQPDHRWTVILKQCIIIVPKTTADAVKNFNLYWNTIFARVI